MTAMNTIFSLHAPLHDFLFIFFLPLYKTEHGSPSKHSDCRPTKMDRVSSNSPKNKFKA